MSQYMGDEWNGASVKAEFEDVKGAASLSSPQDEERTTIGCLCVISFLQNRECDDTTIRMVSLKNEVVSANLVEREAVVFVC